MTLTGTMSGKMEYVLVSVTELQQMAEDIRYLKNAISKILDDHDEWLTTEDVMNFLNCSEKTVYNYRRKGELEYRQRGRKIWYKKADVLEFLDKHHIKVKD